MRSNNGQSTQAYHRVISFGENLAEMVLANIPKIQKKCTILLRYPTENKILFCQFRFRVAVAIFAFIKKFESKYL